MKVATHLAVLSGQRAREMLSVIDIKSIKFKESYYLVRIVDILKTSNAKHHQGQMILPEY